MHHVGWNKQEIQINPVGYAMFGYGMWTHRATQKRTALFARSLSIRDDAGQRLLFTCLDLGCITYAMRVGAIEKLKQELGSDFQDDHLVLTATHTHSGPGGCGYEALYNMPTPGFVPQHLNAIIKAITTSVLIAIRSEKETEIRIGKSRFKESTPVAWNRSLDAYNRNVDIDKKKIHEAHLALNREMQLIGFYRKEKLQAFISLFGVHATCLGNTLSAHDGDNKGYASSFSEKCLEQSGIKGAVAIFAQATAGDVSPHFHGVDQLKVRQKIKGEQEYIYAQRNGRYQAELAMSALTQERTQSISGEVDAILTYVDLADVDISPEFAFGHEGKKTSSACHGASFFAGTPVDGVGAPKMVTQGMKSLSAWVRHKRLKDTQAFDYVNYKKLYDSQGVKQIVIEAGQHKLLGQNLDAMPSLFDPVIAEMNRQVEAGAIQNSLLVPHIIPLQMFRIGSLTVICCAGEITTVAGARLIQTVQNKLQQMDKTKPDDVWLVSYCNDYMGYITTYEEYQQQAYEGGHTLFGQWTHAAFQTQYQQLAEQFNLPAEQRQYDSLTRPQEVPQDELEKRTNHSNTKTAVG